MNLLFIELKPFTRAWRELGLELDELLAVQDLIGKQPGKYPIVPGTGGLRKLRYAAHGSGRGKRGGLRICYAYLERFLIVLLAFAYHKTGAADLTPRQKEQARTHDPGH
jgi:hypothetical protein